MNHDGFVIGDGIIFGLEDDEILYVGLPLAYWSPTRPEISDFDVTTEFDIRALDERRETAQSSTATRCRGRTR
ncbi:MAG: hypothetical protein R3D59_09225 [Paracoccaceae bacterium]